MKRRSAAPSTKHPEPGIQALRHSGSPITNHKSQITFPQSPITNHKSLFPNHQSQITNHGSPIPNHKSRITRSRFRLGPRERLLLFWLALACLLLLTGRLSSGQGQASSNVTFTVGTYLDVRYVCDGTQVWTVVATSRDFCAVRDFLSKGNRPYVVRGSLQVLSGSGTWSFDLNPWQWGNQSTVSRPAGIYSGLATVRYSQPKGKVNAKARLTLSIVAQ